MYKAVYEIKNAEGQTVYTAQDSGYALSFYYKLRDETGYAEAWFRGECFFKTR